MHYNNCKIRRKYPLAIWNGGLSAVEGDWKVDALKSMRYDLQVLLYHDYSKLINNVSSACA